MENNGRDSFRKKRRNSLHERPIFNSSFADGHNDDDKGSSYIRAYQSGFTLPNGNYEQNSGAVVTKLIPNADNGTVDY